jgi:uncharacterized membrane protein YecN with MAPEG domain
MMLKLWWQNGVPTPPELPENYFDQFLSFLYTLSHWLGEFVVNLLDRFLQLQAPANLVDPIGMLMLLTAFLIVTEVAKKVAWLILVIGWVLIVLKIFTATQGS